MKNYLKFQIACYLLCLLICVEYLIRVGYLIYPVVLIPLYVLMILASIKVYRNEKA